MERVASFTALSLAVLGACSVCLVPSWATAQTPGLDASLPADLVEIGAADAASLHAPSLLQMSLWPRSPPLPAAAFFGTSPSGQPRLGLLAALVGSTHYVLYYSPSLAAILVDDRQAAAERALSTAALNSIPMPPGVGGTNSLGGGGGNTNSPPPGPLGYDFGTNLGLLTGLSGGYAVWLQLTNTHQGVLYQLESRLDVRPGSPWQYGQIVEDIQGTNQISFGNVPLGRHAQTYFRSVSGNTVASISLDPDYNLAVEPCSTSDSGSIGKFHITFQPQPTSGFTLVYQISGSATGGVGYASLPGTLTIPASVTSTDMVIQPLPDAPGGAGSVGHAEPGADQWVSGGPKPSCRHNQDLSAAARRHGRGHS